MDGKTCKTCERSLPLSEYSFNRKSRDGLAWTCRECCRSYARMHYAENRDRRLEWQRQYYVAHAQELRDLKRARRAANLEAARAYARDYYQQHKERMLAYAAEARRRKRLGIALHCQALACSNGHIPARLYHVAEHWICTHCAESEFVQVQVNLAGPLSEAAVVRLRVRERAALLVRPIGALAPIGSDRP